jgi:hypothetical protein
MGSAAAMSASIKANAELRKRKRQPFYRVKDGLKNEEFNLQPLSKLENRKIRESRNKTILREQFQNRIVGILVLIPVLWFLHFLITLLIQWW